MTSESIRFISASAAQTILAEHDDQTSLIRLVEELTLPKVLVDQSHPIFFLSSWLVTLSDVGAYVSFRMKIRFDADDKCIYSGPHVVETESMRGGSAFSRMNLTMEGIYIPDTVGYIFVSVQYKISEEDEWSDSNAEWPILITQETEDEEDINSN